MTKFVCNKCGSECAKWMGKCQICNNWNSLEEIVVQLKNGKAAHVGEKLKYKSLQQLEKVELDVRIQTGYREFDRVLGGGIVPGAAILLSGDPGIGKSTLLLQSVLLIAAQGKRVLYVSGEESENQIALRAKRIAVSGLVLDNVMILSANDVDNIIATSEEINPDLLVIDSIQTVESSSVSGVSGGVAQVKECTTLISRYAKSHKISVIIVGHVTKEGNIAGPKILEHLVDAVLYLEGDSFKEFRILRSVKNRYGAQGEIGVFQMNEKGLKEVLNPSELFINPLTAASSGVCLVSVVEGSRPIVLEVQALTSATYPGNARRVGSGVDYSRLQLLTAVIGKCLGYKLQDFDIYANVVCGLKINDPSIDLGICAAIVSSFKNKVIGQSCVFIGEVGL